MVINQRFVQLQNTNMETLIAFIFNLAKQEKKHYKEEHYTIYNANVTRVFMLSVSLLGFHLP